MINKKSTAFLFLIVIICHISQAQNIENIGKNIKKEPVTFSGGISVNNTLFNAWGVPERRSPFVYYISGKLSAKYMQWTIPVSFVFSDQAAAYNTPQLKPYNHYGISPYYKWIKFHLGRSTINFSSLTMAQSFFGAGVELTPKGPFSFSCMYGKLHDAVKADTAYSRPPVYKRTGYASKVQYKFENGFINFILFGAKDHPGSIHYIPDSTMVKPMENLILNVNSSVTIAGKLSLETEYANSLLTRDVNTYNRESDPEGIYRHTGFLMKQNETSATHNAMKSNLRYGASKFSLSLGYERIDPEYRTLGIPYMTNDLENVTVNGSLQLLKGKVGLNGSVGKQRNNLDGDKVSSMSNTVGSFNLTCVPSKRINLAANYSNFTSYSLMRSNFEDINRITPYEYIDTLDLKQVNQNANLNSTFILSSLTNKDKQQVMNINLAYQRASDNKPDTVIQAIGPQNLNGNFLYNYIYNPLDLSVSLSVNTNINSYIYKTVTMGPTMSVSKLFYEKTLRTVFSCSYNDTYNDSIKEREILTFRTSANMKLKEKHQFNVSLSLQNVKSHNEQYNSLTEFTATMGYNYTF